MNADQAKKLRAPFPPEQIGKLPKAGTLLDYVGHASVTDRLLQVDPEWTWEPMAVNEHGAPVVSDGGLWIWLTVCGVRRPGWGDGKNIKEMIGDAIRNAAMRFGVALDLWAKEDLQGSEGGPAAPPGGGQEPAVGRSGFPSSDKSPAPDAVRGGGSPFDPPAGATDRPDGGISDAQIKRLWAIVKEHGVPHPEVQKIVVDVTGQSKTHGIKKGRDYDAVIAAVQAYQGEAA